MTDAVVMVEPGLGFVAAFALCFALASGSALIALAVSQLVFIRPLQRRLAALEAEAGSLRGGLEAAASLESRLRRAERGFGAQLARLTDRLGQLELRSDARGYEQAIHLAGRGEAADHLVNYLGLTEGEAALVRLLHGEKSRQSTE